MYMTKPHSIKHYANSVTLKWQNLSFCQSLNLATVEEIFVQLSQLAESLIIAARDWLYHQACTEMGTPMDERGNPQQLYIIF